MSSSSSSSVRGDAATAASSSGTQAPVAHGALVVSQYAVRGVPTGDNDAEEADTASMLPNTITTPRRSSTVVIGQRIAEESSGLAMYACQPTRYHRTRTPSPAPRPGGAPF